MCVEFQLIWSFFFRDTIELPKHVKFHLDQFAYTENDHKKDENTMPNYVLKSKVFPYSWHNIIEVDYFLVAIDHLQLIHIDPV